ncbi:MAG: hypothetical protein K0S18_3 [Anaerocolumna sp.]|nr:hypothetical protein [Anaerocolumna sp.]
MDEYYLFLDEIKPNAFGTYFALGGYAIKIDDYENILKPKLQKIKIENMPNPELPLHLYDMRKNRKGFEFLTDNTIRIKLFEGIKKLIKELDIEVFVSSIDTKKYSDMYFNNHTNDIYNITLQIILENFVHFLLSKNATGSFFIESRNLKENKYLQICYYRLITGGTLFIDSMTIMDRLSILSFPLKSDNNLGVQLADFIPMAFVRHLINSNDYCGLYAIFKDKVYKGYNDCTESRFGFKNLLE